jgi:hypothetical protein
LDECCPELALRSSVVSEREAEGQVVVAVIASGKGSIENGAISEGHQFLTVPLIDLQAG